MHLLGRPYQLSGAVVHGDKRGRTIGFPTANLALPDPWKLIPANGVYAVKVLLARNLGSCHDEHRRKANIQWYHTAP
jgi:FAD synthase